MRFRVFIATLAAASPSFAGASTVEVSPGEDWCGLRAELERLAE